MQDTIDDIKGLINNARGDLSPVDFVDLAMIVIADIRHIADEAQDEIDAHVESCVDSFGGDVTMRQLKGE